MESPHLIYRQSDLIFVLISVSLLEVRQIKNLNVSIFPRLVDINLACPLDFENERYFSHFVFCFLLLESSVTVSL